MSSATRRLSVFRVLRAAEALPDDAEGKRLTEEYLRVRRSANATTVTAVLRLGRIIIKWRATHKKGYYDWLREIGAGRTTAMQQRRLATWANANPGAIDALASLGLAKLYRISVLCAAGTRYLLTQDLQTLERMSFRPFLTAIARFQRRPRREETRRLTGHRWAAALERWRIMVKSWTRYLPRDPSARKRLLAGAMSLEHEVQRLRKRI